MATMLAQTKRMIEALKAAGYQRKEFRVRTPYDHDLGGYGATEIIVWASKERQMALLDAVLANGINATICKRKDDPSDVGSYPLYSESYDGSGKLSIIEYLDLG